MKPSVLFICRGDSCRSQMAEGFLRHYVGNRFEVASVRDEIDGHIRQFVAEAR